MAEIDSLEDDMTFEPPNIPENMYKDAYIDALHDVREAVREVEAHEWTHVSEETPRENGTYMATYESDGLRWLGLVVWTGHWFELSNNLMPEGAEVIAWKPLPTPYSGK